MNAAKVVKQLREANREGWSTTLAFFEWANSITITPQETTYEELQAALKLTKLEARRFAADIEAVGIGTRIFGRRSFKSRIRWNYTLASTAKAARGLSDSLEPVSKSNFPIAKNGTETKTDSSSPDDVEHAFRLRSDRSVLFFLPRDLTSKEAERLAAFIKTLPLE